MWWLVVMREIFENIIMCLIGGTLYVGVEILMRGYSHYSMFVCGGMCFLLVGATGKNILENNRRAVKAIVNIMIMGSLIITTLELGTGIVVNLLFRMNVWDYSDMNYNVMGQICPLFSALWALLSLPCVYINSVIRKYIFGEKIEYM